MGGCAQKAYFFTAEICAQLFADRNVNGLVSFAAVLTFAINARITVSLLGIPIPYPVGGRAAGLPCRLDFVVFSTGTARVGMCVYTSD